MKIAFSATMIVLLLVKQFAISIDLVSVFHLRYMVLLSRKVVNNTVMHAKIRAIPWLRNMEVLKLLMLRWHSFSGCRRVHGTVVFAIKGCQYIIKGRWPCCYLFYQSTRPIRPLCITTTKSLVNYRTHKTRNRWRSVDAHAQNAAVTVMLSLFPINAASMSVMHNNDQVTGELPYL